MDDLKEMPLVGYYHFTSKDKTKVFYVVQVLFSENDLSQNTNKGTLLNIFVNDNIYNTVSNSNFGDLLPVKISTNFSTGKLYYSIEL